MTKLLHTVGCWHAIQSNARHSCCCGCTPCLPDVSVLQLCAGAIRSKNTMNILLQTILDAAVSAICWYLVGCVVLSKSMLMTRDDSRDSMFLFG